MQRLFPCSGQFCHLPHSALVFLSAACLSIRFIRPPPLLFLPNSQFRNSFTRSATSVKHSPKEVQYPLSAWASHRSLDRPISIQPCHPYLAFTTQATRLCSGPNS